MQTLQQIRRGQKKIDNLSRGGKIDVDIKTVERKEKKQKKEHKNRKTVHLQCSMGISKRMRIVLTVRMETLKFTLCFNCMKFQ